MLKKSRNQVTTEQPVKIKQTIPYGGHFPRNQPTQLSQLNQNQTSHHSRHRNYQIKPYTKLARNNTNTINNNYSSTSSQNLAAERIKSHKRKREDDDLRAVSGTRKEKNYKSAVAQLSSGANVTVGTTNDGKHQKYLNLSQVPGDICLETIIDENRADDKMDERMETDVKNNQMETTNETDKNKESKKEEQHQQSQQQSSLEIAASGKRHLQSHVLKEKGLFAHYTMWKYIEELPDEWTDEATNLATMDAGGPSLCGNNQLLEMEAFSPKNDAALSSHKHNKKNPDESQDGSETSSETEEVPAVAKPLSSTVQPIVTSSQHQSNQQPLHSAITPQQSLKSRASSVTSITPQVISQGLATSANQHITLAQHPPSTPPNLINFIKKTTSSLSSKSHSKIVLVDENDNNDDEEPSNTTNKLIGAGTDFLNLSGLVDTSNPINNNISSLPGNAITNTNTGLVIMGSNMPSSTTATPIVSNILSAQQSGASQQAQTVHKTVMGHHTFSTGSILPSASMVMIGQPTVPINSSSQPSKHQDQPVRWENPIRLTVDVLAKHTAEQDELFSLEILKSLK